MQRYLIPDIATFTCTNAPCSPELMPVHRTQQNIKGSLFLCSMGHASEIEHARSFIEQIKKEFSDATHNCWAFAVGPPKDTARVGFSDDGEPHGTAGRPMLNVLHHAKVGELVCVVTRYFGGTKLGTGGLVRAYQGAVAENLLTLPTVERITPVYLNIVIEYSHIDNFRRLLPSYEAKILQEIFTADAAFNVILPKENLSNFTNALTNLTDAMVLIDIVEVD